MKDILSFLEEVKKEAESNIDFLYGFSYDIANI